MVSDRTTVLSRYFGILNEETGNSERWTFIIDPDGVLKTVEIHTEPLGRSSDELVRKLHALRFIRQNPGNACVASWNGESSPKLQPSIKIAGEVAENLK
jgi:peroxiredoxin (alkyl hydroperoxide reductase subunit C)